MCAGNQAAAMPARHGRANGRYPKAPYLTCAGGLPSKTSARNLSRLSFSQRVGHVSQHLSGRHRSARVAPGQPIHDKEAVRPDGGQGLHQRVRQRLLHRHVSLRVQATGSKAAGPMSLVRFWEWALANVIRRRLRLRRQPSGRAAFPRCQNESGDRPQRV